MPSCKTVAFIVTEEMRAESIVARKIRRRRIKIRIVPQV